MYQSQTANMEFRERKRRFCIMPPCKGERFDLVHKFPMDNERAEMWRQIINIPELNECPIETIRKNKFICSRHFRQEDYKNVESRSLNKTALPCLNLTGLDDSDGNINYEGNDKLLPEMEIGSTNGNEILNDDLNEQVVLVSPEEEELPPIAAISTLAVQSSPSSGKKNIEICLANKRRIQSPVIIKEEIGVKGKSQKIQFDPPPEVELSNIQEGNDSEIVQASLPNIEIFSILHVVDNQILSTLDSVKLKTVQLSETFTVNGLSDDACDTITIESTDPVNKPLELTLEWLQDFCRCSYCWCSRTQRRKSNLYGFSNNIRISEYSIDGNQLRIQWSNDHKSIYNIHELYDCESKKSNKNMKLSSQIYPWNASEIHTANFAKHSMFDYLRDEDVSLKIVSSLLEYGIAFINEVPLNELSGKMAIAKLFRILDEPDSSLRKKSLIAGEVHTDQSFLHDPPGLLFYHCIDNVNDDGLFRLADGFHVFNILKSHNPEVHASITEMPVEYVYESNSERFSFVGPIVGLDPKTMEPQQIRYCPYHRSTPTYLDNCNIPQYYRNWEQFSLLTRSVDNCWNFKLEPGVLMIVDNWRILCGQIMSRNIQSKYFKYSVSRDEFLNVAQTLNICR